MLAELIGKQQNSRLTTKVQFAARVGRAQSLMAPSGWGRRGIWVLDALLRMLRSARVGSLHVHGLCARFGRCYVCQSSCDRVRCDGMRVAMCCRARRACLLMSSLCDGRRARSGDGGAGCFEGNLGVT